MKQCIHLKYDRDRAMQSFISSSTPFNVKKKSVYLFDAKTGFSSFVPFQSRTLLGFGNLWGRVDGEEE